MASVAGVSESAAFVRSKKKENLLKKTLMKKEKKLKKKEKKVKKEKKKSPEKKKQPQEQQQPQVVLSDEMRKERDILEELFSIADELNAVPHQPPIQQPNQLPPNTMDDDQEQHPMDDFEVHSLEDLI